VPRRRIFVVFVGGVFRSHGREDLDIEFGGLPPSALL